MSATATAEHPPKSGAQEPGHDGGGHGAGDAGHGGGGHGGGHGDGHGGGGHGGAHGGHKQKHAPPPAKGPGAPLWMLSFADMMTNLLCFFILMAAFATVQESLQFEDWLGSIRTALDNNSRLNALDGHQAAFQFGAGRVIFRAASPVSSRTLVEEDGRILDANRDALRNVVVDAMSQPGRVTLPTPILFEPGVTTLSAGHRTFLDEVAPMLATGTYPIRLTGFAFEEGASEMDGWAISEARARHAKEHLVARGIDAARISVVGFGCLRYGADTRVGATPLAQNRFGRRAVIITLLEAP